MSAEDETEVQEPLDSDSAPRPLARRLLVPVLGAVVSAGLAFAFAGIVQPTGEKELQFGEPFLVALPTVQVTLADPDRQAFARVTIHVEMQAEQESTILARIGGERAIVIKDALNMHISGKTGSQLKTPGDKELLKLELIDLLDSKLFEDGDGRILAIYYQEFMIQG